jgi:hypothetical protein
MLECVGGNCPLGYACTHVDFGGGNAYDLCLLNE